MMKQGQHDKGGTEYVANDGGICDGEEEEEEEEIKNINLFRTGMTKNQLSTNL
jgi:hypothetical protein